MTRFTSDLNAIRMAIGMAVISAFDATVMTQAIMGHTSILTYWWNATNRPKVISPTIAR